MTDTLESPVRAVHEAETLRFTTTRKALLDAVTLAAGAIAKRTTLPVLSNVLIETGINTMLIRATDLETAISVPVEVTSASPGRTTIDAALLLASLKALPEGTITSHNGRLLELVLTQQNAVLRFMGIDAEDFPQLMQWEDGNGYSTIDAQALKAAVRNALVAVAGDETRPVLAGICLWRVPSGYSVISADGFRLTVIEIADPMEDDYGQLDGQQLIIPRRSADTLLGAIGDAETLSIQLQNGNGSAVFKGDTWPAGMSFGSRLIDGTFPDVDLIMPKTFATTVDFDAAAMLSVVRACRVVARTTNNLIRMSIGVDQIGITANDASGNSVSDILTDVVITGQHLTINLNGDYLAHYLATVPKGERVLMQLNGPNTAMVFVVGSYTHVIMPMITSAAVNLVVAS